ncbi:hypothetical protein KIN20_024526 [Parelaphostrongylus tenuis]|uniref:Uncharacterized protein n=1 Tax=Parelaphostrongylus tenuis TaxID=148309 RepID=A0AAD5MYD4_PARTN|nr:hypothetical protein KIN20_024526 [Parelaphostrongylus tenuis]
MPDVPGMNGILVEQIAAKSATEVLVWDLIISTTNKGSQSKCDGRTTKNVKVVGVVTFVRPGRSDFAQYISLREINENAPMEHYEYFMPLRARITKWRL